MKGPSGLFLQWSDRLAVHQHLQQRLPDPFRESSMREDELSLIHCSGFGDSLELFCVESLSFSDL